MIDKKLLEFLKMIFLELSKILGYGLIYSAGILMLLCGLCIIVVTSKNLLNKNINIKLPNKITAFILKMSKKVKLVLEYCLFIYATGCVMYALWDMVSKYILE